MATEFGKFLRKLRIDQNETLKEMADKFEYAPSYLSGIENGKRNIPKTLLEKIVDTYNLPSAQADILKDIVQRSVPVFEIENDDDNEAKQDVLIKMSNKQVTNEQYEQILKLLERGKI